jgi:hypothetical protein
MVDYDEVGYFCGKHEIVFHFVLQPVLIYFVRSNRALVNASGNLTRVETNALRSCNRGNYLHVTGDMVLIMLLILLRSGRTCMSMLDGTIFLPIQCLGSQVPSVETGGVRGGEGKEGCNGGGKSRDAGPER